TVSCRFSINLSTWALDRKPSSRSWSATKSLTTLSTLGFSTPPPTCVCLSVPHDPTGEILTDHHADIDPGLPVDRISITTWLYDQPRSDLGRRDEFSQGAQASAASPLGPYPLGFSPSAFDLLPLRLQHRRNCTNRVSVGLVVPGLAQVIGG